MTWEGEWCQLAGESHRRGSIRFQRLVDQGLVSKIAAADDARRQSVAVTAEGRRALQRTAAAVQDREISSRELYTLRIQNIESPSL